MVCGAQWGAVGPRERAGGRAGGGMVAAWGGGLTEGPDCPVGVVAADSEDDRALLLHRVVTVGPGAIVERVELALLRVAALERKVVA